MSATVTPHDALFKKFMSQPVLARQFLDIHLPPVIHQHCDLDTLQLVPTSFIERDLSAFYSDVLFSMGTGKAGLLPSFPVGRYYRDPG